MAIGKSFEEAIQKAVRMVSGGVMDGLEGALSSQPSAEELETLLRVPTGQVTPLSWPSVRDTGSAA